MNLENEILYKNIEELPLFLSVADISKITGLGKNNAYDLMHDKNFPSKQVGNRWIVPKMGLIEWMKNPQ